MVRHHKQALVTEPQPFHLHRGGCHCECLARAYNVGEQRVASVDYPRDGVLLMLAELYLGVHADKLYMSAVILARTGAVEALIVNSGEPFAPAGILPYPFAEGVLYRLLFLLGEDRFLLIKNSDLSAGGRIAHRVEYADVFEVQGLLDDLVGVDPVRTVGYRRRRVIVVRVLIGQMPFRRNGRILHLYPSPRPIGGGKQLVHEVLHYVGRQPGRAETDVYIRRGELGRLYLFKSGYAHLHVLKLLLVRFIGRRFEHLIQPPCLFQLVTHVPRKEFIRGNERISVPSVWLAHEVGRIKLGYVAEDYAFKLFFQLAFRLAGQLRHIRKIDLRLFI